LVHPGSFRSEVSGQVQNPVEVPARSVKIAISDLTTQSGQGVGAITILSILKPQLDYIEHGEEKPSMVTIDASALRSSRDHLIEAL
jgi:hypothetical protein